MVKELGFEAYLGEGTVVPKIALVWEAVADESKLALLNVLLDGVQIFFFRDLSLGVSNMYLRIRHSGHRNSKVEMHHVSTMERVLRVYKLLAASMCFYFLGAN